MRFSHSLPAQTGHVQALTSEPNNDPSADHYSEIPSCTAPSRWNNQDSPPRRSPGAAGVKDGLFWALLPTIGAKLRSMKAILITCRLSLVSSPVLAFWHCYQKSMICLSLGIERLEVGVRAIAVEHLTVQYEDTLPSCPRADVWIFGMVRNLSTIVLAFPI